MRNEDGKLFLRESQGGELVRGEGAKASAFHFAERSPLGLPGNDDDPRGTDEVLLPVILQIVPDGGAGRELDISAVAPGAGPRRGQRA